MGEDGTVRLFYETPDGDDARAERGARSALERAGWVVDVTRPSGVLCLTGRPPA